MGSNYAYFFYKYVLHYYMFYSWLNLWIQNLGYRMPIHKVIGGYLTPHRGSMPLTPAWVKGQMCMQFWC